MWFLLTHRPDYLEHSEGRKRGAAHGGSSGPEPMALSRSAEGATVEREQPPIKDIF